MVTASLILLLCSLQPQLDLCLLTDVHPSSTLAGAFLLQNYSQKIISLRHGVPLSLTIPYYHNPVNNLCEDDGSYER